MTTTKPAARRSAAPAGKRPQVVVVAQASPAQGGIASFAENIVGDPTLAQYASVRLLNTTRVAVRQAGVLSFGNVLHAVTDVVRVFRASRSADVVHLQVAPGRLFPLLRSVALVAAGRLGGAAVLCHVHSGRLNGGTPDGFRPSRPFRIMLRGLAASTAILTVSNAGTRTLRHHIPGARIETVNNAVDVRRFTPARPAAKPVTLLFVGTLSYRKGLADLLAAVQELSRRGDLPEWRLVVVGGAAEVGEPEADSIREAYRSAGFAESLVGPKHGGDLIKQFAAAGVFVLPSHWEGQPMVILEAMSAGLPIVSTTVGAIPDVVSGDEGILVAPHDIDALADALDRLIRDPDERARLGANARQRAESAHDMPILARRLADLYAEAAAR